MPRRQQRRPAFRPPKGRSNRDEDAGALEAGARRVLANTGHDRSRLEALVRDLRQLKEEADRVAFDEPSTEALREYRRVSRELAEAERALAMAEAA